MLIQYKLYSNYTKQLYIGILNTNNFDCVLTRTMSNSLIIESGGYTIYESNSETIIELIFTSLIEACNGQKISLADLGYIMPCEKKYDNKCTDKILYRHDELYGAY